MGFDPAEFAKKHAATAPTGFDPVAFGKSAAPSSQEGSASEAALAGFGNTASMGYLPQLQALASKPLYAGMNLLTGQDVQPEDYLTERDSAIKRLETLKKQSPNAMLAGELGGGLASGIATGAGLGKLGLGAAAEGATLGQKMLQASKIGATLGAAQNPGDVKGEVSPWQLGDRAIGAGVGGAAGGLLEGAMGGVSNLASSAKDKFRPMAEKRAFKALGPYAASVKNLDPERINEVGGVVLDSGALKGLPGYETIAKRLDPVRDTAGKELQATIDSITRDNPELVVNKNAIIEKILSKVSSKLTTSEEAAARGQIEDLLSKQGKRLDMNDIESAKRFLGDKINWNTNLLGPRPASVTVAKGAYTTLKNEAEDMAKQAADKIGVEAGKKFLDQKRLFGNLSIAAPIAEKRAGKEFVNRMISPSDYATTLGGAGLGYALGGEGHRKEGMLAGAALGGVNSFARNYGNALTAKLLNQLSKGAGKAATGAISPGMAGALGAQLPYSILNKGE